MNQSLSNIKAVGVDLDKTLYRDTPEMHNYILKQVAKKILLAKPGLKSLKKVSAIYGNKKLYKKLDNSWSKILRLAGIDNPKAEIAKIYESSTKIIDFIKRDPQLVKILENLSKKYFLFIISGSHKKDAYQKLKKIGIKPSLFDFSLFGDDPNFIQKTEPDSFKYFLSKSPHQPGEHVYIGDNPKADIEIPKSLGLKTIVVGPICEHADFSVNRIHHIKKLLL